MLRKENATKECIKYVSKRKEIPTMALTVNTNISSIIAQRSLNKATNSMNTSLERMSTGYKINHAKDNAAGYSIANSWETKLGSLDVAANNAATGLDLLTTAEETYSLLTSHLQRVRDLTEQAANGTYGSQSLKAIQSEISARLHEINRLSANAEFNGIKLMAYDKNNAANNSDVGITSAGLNLQVGLYADENSIINLDAELFSKANLSGLFVGQFNNTYDVTGGTKNLSDLLTAAGAKNGTNPIDLKDDQGVEGFAAACTGLRYIKGTGGAEDKYWLQTNGNFGAKEMLKFLDASIDDISSRVTKIGAVQNRVESAAEALDVQSQNLTSSLSTLRDTDIADESSTYIQQQILQQASATLLSTANQLPSIALNLI